MSLEEIQQIFFRKLDEIDTKYGYGKMGYDSIKWFCELKPNQVGSIDLKITGAFPDEMIKEVFAAWDEIISKY